MEKKTYRNVTLTCIWQGTDGFKKARLPKGTISKDQENILFEESAQPAREVRNKKLFDGTYCSLVRMKNGLYQIHMRTIDAPSTLNLFNLAFQIYTELLKAFQIIQ